MPVSDRFPPRRRIEILAAVAILAFGAVLRSVQYGAQGSLWLDELKLAISVAERDMGASSADAETHPYPQATRISRARVLGCDYSRVPGRIGLPSAPTSVALRTQSSSGNSRSR